MYTSYAKLIKKDGQLFSLRAFSNGLSTAFNRSKRLMKVFKNIGGKDVVILQNIRLSTDKEYDEFMCRVENSKI